MSQTTPHTWQPHKAPMTWWLLFVLCGVFALHLSLSQHEGTLLDDSYTVGVVNLEIEGSEEHLETDFGCVSQDTLYDHHVYHYQQCSPPIHLLRRPVTPTSVQPRAPPFV